MTNPDGAGVVQTPALDRVAEQGWRDIVSHLQGNFLSLTGHEVREIATFAVERLMTPLRVATLQDMATNLQRSSLPPEIVQAMTDAAAEAEQEQANGRG